MDLNQISPELLDELKNIFTASKNKHRLVDPEKIKTMPFFIMTEALVKLVTLTEKDLNLHGDQFLKYYSVCLRGLSPFKDSQLKKAGIDPKAWKKLLRAVAKDY